MIQCILVRSYFLDAYLEIRPKRSPVPYQENRVCPPTLAIVVRLNRVQALFFILKSQNYFIYVFTSAN